MDISGIRTMKVPIGRDGRRTGLYAMKRYLALLFFSLLSSPLFSQGLIGNWRVREGSDGSSLVVSLYEDGSGVACLSLVRRAEAIQSGGGSRFWGTFRVSGGYFFLVFGDWSCPIEWEAAEDSLSIRSAGQPTLTVDAKLDVAYSTKDMSDWGDYKKEIVSQWKRDFTDNEDVEKHKAFMSEYLESFYSDVFDDLVIGVYSITRDGQAMILKDPTRNLTFQWAMINP